MHEIDFLKVGTEGKSGDAIALRFPYQGIWAVVIIDGGFVDVGNELVEHVKQWYQTDHVDLVISTHPDADHINGLTPVLEGLDVGELFIHLPRLHRTDVSDWSAEAVDDLVRVALRSITSHSLTLPDWARCRLLPHQGGLARQWGWLYVSWRARRSSIYRLRP